MTHTSPDSYRTLIDAKSLQALMASGRKLHIVDVSFELAEPELGEHAFEARHVPGAVYAHLDRDLSGAKTGRNGRHPLPSLDSFAHTVARLGITPETQVVAQYINLKRRLNWAIGMSQQPYFFYSWGIYF